MASPNDLIVSGRARIGVNPAAGSDPQLLSALNLLNVAGQNGTEVWFADYDNSGGFINGLNLKLAAARGTPAVPLILQNGDYVFELESFAYNGTSFMEGAEIKVTVDTATGGAIVAGQAIPTRLEIWTNITNATPTLKSYWSAYGTLVTLATAAGGAGLNLPHGVVPTSPVDGDLWTTSAGGLFGRINGVTQNYAPLASPTFTGTVTVSALTANGLVTFNAGIAASGATANTWAGASGTFITSTGANTLSGAVDVNAAATPSITLNSGKTNTGFLLINGKTSGSLKLITADATAQAVTFTLAAQTVGAATLTFPDLVGVAKTVPYLERAQTFTTVQTFTLAPVFTAATATTILAVDGSKALVSYTLSGTGTVVAMTASPTFTGTVGAAAITMTGTLTINNATARLQTNTSDGSDNATLIVSSAGGSGSSRGSYIQLYGNEHASTGNIDLVPGTTGTFIVSSAGSNSFTITSTGATGVVANIATTAGGSTVGLRFGSSAVVGIFFGSGAPTISAPKGALYLRTDGSATNNRAYINTDGATTWTALTTAA